MQRSAERSASSSASPSTRTPSIPRPAEPQNFLPLFGDYSNLGVNILNLRLNLFGQEFSLRDLFTTTTTTLNSIREIFVTLLQTRLFNGMPITEENITNVSYSIISY